MSDFVISISYGNYLIQNGGTDKVIREHQQMFSKKGLDYLFVFPVIRDIKIGRLKKTIRYWGININKKLIGLYKLDGVLNYIGCFINNGNNCKALFIHHTWRIPNESLTKILAMVDAPIYFYLHDFHSICDGKNLINQDGRYCGYGLFHYNCKRECSYHEQSIDNKTNFLSLISRFIDRLIFIAPSDNTRDIYRKTFPAYEEKFIAIPHQKLEGQYKKKQIGRPIRIAFIGKQDAIKGWNDFKFIVNQITDEENYSFYYLGTGTEYLKNVTVKEVSVREQGPDAMLKTLRELDIDVVLLLSNWPETYSYTYFEAFASDCYVISYNCSGNIADMLQNVGNGMSVNSVNQIITLLQDPTNMYSLLEEYTMRSNCPAKLVPNDTIIEMVLDKNVSYISLESVHKAKKSHYAEFVYRLQNRDKFKKIGKY